jgi:hypothetical protein
VVTVWSKDGDCFVDRVAGVLLQERGRFARWGEAGPFAWTVNAIAAQVASCVNVWISPIYLALLLHSRIAYHS